MVTLFNAHSFINMNIYIHTHMFIWDSGSFALSLSWINSNKGSQDLILCSKIISVYNNNKIIKSI